MSPAIIDYLTDCVQRGLAQETIEGYSRPLSEAEEFCNRVGAEVASMSPSQLDMFAAEMMGKGLAHATVDQFKIRLRGFQRFARRESSVDTSNDIVDFLVECAQRGLSKRTIQKFSWALSKAEKFCMAIGVELSAMSASDVEMFANKMAETRLAATTVHDAKNKLKKFLKHRSGRLGSTDGDMGLGNIPDCIGGILKACEQRSLAKSTIEGYKSTLLKAKEFFDERNVILTSLASDQLEIFAKELVARGFAQKTVGTHISRLRGLFKIPDTNKIRIARPSAGSRVTKGDAKPPVDVLPKKKIRVRTSTDDLHKKKIRAKTPKDVSQKKKKTRTNTSIDRSQKRKSGAKKSTVELPKEIEEYLNDCKKKNFNKGTIGNYKTSLCDAKQFFDANGFELVSVTSSQANKFVINLLSRGLAHETILRILNTLHRFLRFHGSNKISNSLPLVRKMLEKKTFTSSSPSLKELPLLLNEVDSCGMPKYIAIFYLLFEMGIPVSELCGLMIADLELGFNDQFDFTDWSGKVSGAMKLRIRGTHLDRTLPVPMRTELAILNYMAAQRSQPQSSPNLFPNRNGDKAIIPMVVYRKMKAFFKNVKTGKKGSLALRHAHVRELFESEADFRTIWALSGYKCSQSVERHRASKVVPVGSIYRRAHPRSQ